MPYSTNDFWLIVSRTLSGEATHAEHAQLAAILEENPHLQQQYEILFSVWHTSRSQQASSEEAAAHEAYMLIKRADEAQLIAGYPKPKSQKVYYRILSIAAVVASIMAVGFWLLPQKKVSSTQVAAAVLPKLTTTNGSRSRNVLPDGSVVWLNAGSQLTLSPNFTNSNREVTLEGEAYFDVVKNKHSFTVHTSDADVKVLGTVFNVKSYPRDKTIETTLISGRVSIVLKSDKRIIKLQPNQKYTLVKNEAVIKNIAGNTFPKGVLQTELINLPAVEPEKFIETAWLYNRLEFHGDNFETLAPKLERWYNVQLVFMDDQVKQIQFNGSFENENVQQAFVALQTAVKFNYKIKGNEIFISTSK